MSLSPQIRKHIYPVLRRQGFEKLESGWRLESSDGWIILVETSSSKYGDDGLYHLRIDIGVYSRELDDLMGWGRRAGFNEHSPIPMPPSVLLCHIWVGLFDVDEDGAWVGVPDNFFLPKGKASEAQFLEFASKLERVIPGVIEKYASYESVIECKKKKICRESQSKQGSMYAAAACIKLGRYDEAREFLDDAVRPGSIQFMKDIGARLEEELVKSAS